MGFFIALFACVAVAWFFAQVQKQGNADEEQTASATDSLYDTTHARSVSRTTPRHSSEPSRASDHGVTYYLDEDGNILDVVRF